MSRNLIRTPSIKKSVKARTSGRVSRSIKSSLNPYYGKSGMGYINNPKSATYNKMYHKTSSSSVNVIVAVIVMGIVALSIYIPVVLMSSMFNMINEVIFK